MPHRTTTPRTRARTIGCALLVAALASCDRGADASPQTTPGSAVLSDALVERALAIRIPERLTLSDEIDFFARRLAVNPNDDVARARLVAAHQLRFQVYGQASDLTAAEEYASAQLGSDEAVAALSLARHEFARAADAAHRAHATARGDAVSDANARLFDVALALGRHEEAERALQSMNREETFGRLVREARLLDRKGRLDLALPKQRRAVELAAAYAESAAVQAWSLMQLAHFEYHSGRAGAAVPLVERALALLPGMPAAYEVLGMIAYAVDGNLESADRLLARAIENGGHLDLLLMRADIALARGESAAARAHRAQFLAIAQQDDATARLYYPVLARELAADSASRGLALAYAERDVAERRSATSLAAYAWALQHDGRVDEARQQFEAALAWGTPEPVVYELAGLAALARGEHQVATSLLAVALDAEQELGPVAALRIRRALNDHAREEAM